MSAWFPFIVRGYPVPRRQPFRDGWRLARAGLSRCVITTELLRDMPEGAEGRVAGAAGVQGAFAEALFTSTRSTPLSDFAFLSRSSSGSTTPRCHIRHTVARRQTKCSWVRLQSMPPVERVFGENLHSQSEPLHLAQENDRRSLRLLNQSATEPDLWR